MRTLLTSILLLFTLPSVAQIVTYNFAGAPGSQVSQPAASNDPSLTASAIRRGSGIVEIAGTGSINSRNWNRLSQDASDYYEFTLNPTSGHQLNITHLDFFINKSATGPNNYLVAYSIGGGPETTASSGTIPTANVDQSVGITLSINTPQPVRFRIYAWGATNVLGTLKLTNTLTVTGAAPLPVGLISFTAIPTDQAIVLNWSTSWEDKNEGFDILKGQTPNSLERIAFVRGNNTTQATSFYSFTDSAVQAGQLYYYQLKQRDIGGRSTPSNLIGARANTGVDERKPTVYPNPNPGNFTLSANDLAVSDIRLYNITGTEIPLHIVKNQTANSYSIKLLSSVLPGLYYLKLGATSDRTFKTLGVVIH
ncbi:hypothetical protein GCM10028805_34650 [Spirosoma harenae]